MKNKTWYKVFRRFGGRLTSAWVIQGRVEYVPGQWAKPQRGAGPLACFATLDLARRWCEANLPNFEDCDVNWLEVWAVEAKPWNKKLPRFLTPQGWKPWFMWFKDWACMRTVPPHGTRLARAVKPIRRVALY